MKWWHLELYHPDSPGVRVWVWRNWWRRLLYPRDFATIGEVLKNYKERLR